jgi:acetylxylan esterase
MLFSRISASLALFTSTTLAASLTKVTGWGNNPTGLNMYVYVPNNVAANPAIVVAMHYCGGSASAYFSYTKFPQYADQYGFIVIYPESPHDSNCFDVGTSATQTHNGGGDSLGIVTMVKYAINTYKADSSRVFAVGSSSGGMMTETLCGAYPDVFAAGAPFSGVPFSCIQGSGSSPSSANPACANGQITKTGQQWAQAVYNAYPGYTGPYPRMQIWHGTADSLVTYTNFGEQIKMWSTIHNVAFTRNQTNTPTNGFTEMIYGDGTKLQGYSQAGGGHPTQVQEVAVLTFFGIIGGSNPGTTTRPTTTTTRPTTSVPGPTTSTAPTGCLSPQYGQCGGMGWTGCTACVSPFTCKYSNPYYSQCL